jgi:3-methyladenine DNA glycosylase/8-oxoguanine DNA glycosylase
MAGLASLCACQENSVEAFKRLTELFEELTGDKVSYLAMPPPSSRTLSLSEDDKRIVTEVVMGMLKLKADNAGLKVH